MISTDFLLFTNLFTAQIDYSVMASSLRGSNNLKKAIITGLRKQRFNLHCPYTFDGKYVFEIWLIYICICIFVFVCVCDLFLVTLSELQKSFLVWHVSQWSREAWCAAVHGVRKSQT